MISIKGFVIIRDNNLKNDIKRIINNQTFYTPINTDYNDWVRLVTFCIQHLPLNVTYKSCYLYLIFTTNILQKY